MKNILNIFFIAYLLLFVGCAETVEPEKPARLIAEEKMIDILTDAYLSNAARSVNNRLIRDKGVMLDSLIYSKHNIDSLQFAQSNAYYAAQMDTYSEMFKEVEARLMRLKKESDSLQPNSNRRRKDTIKGGPTLIQSQETDPEETSDE
ncbi:MAG: DUF4296 domain-containing protein [Flavobacteriales bacterium]|uniref:DUF4296 domain-containing protein n=1 Tax=Candidatus Ulvibacter alkanivorans TaxID=2267620 RepID=UPI000DF425D2|nr:DUF4296 domain-containing protein [Candidatus Ulvibacter alkanivorans]MCH2490354.1 DUF4296 domain-containing protein [Flavobacteriales bacterium]